MKRYPKNKNKEKISIICYECDGTGKSIKNEKQSCDICKGEGKVEGYFTNE